MRRAIIALLVLSSLAVLALWPLSFVLPYRWNPPENYDWFPPSLVFADGKFSISPPEHIVGHVYRPSLALLSDSVRVRSGPGSMPGCPECSQTTAAVAFLGFRFEKRKCDRYLDFWSNVTLEIPLWMALLCGAPVPTIAFVRGPYRRWHRRRRSRCVECG